MLTNRIIIIVSQIVIFLGLLNQYVLKHSIGYLPVDVRRSINVHCMGGVCTECAGKSDQSRMSTTLIKAILTTPLNVSCSVQQQRFAHLVNSIASSRKYWSTGKVLPWTQRKTTKITDMSKLRLLC